MRWSRTGFGLRPPGGLFGPRSEPVHGVDLVQDVGGKKVSQGEDRGTAKQKDSQAVAICLCRDLPPVPPSWTVTVVFYGTL